MRMKKVFILSATRSPIGRFGGALASFHPAELAAPVFRSALDHASVPDQLLNLVLLGNVLRGGHGQLVARQAAKFAGIPDSVDAVSIDMVCSSGMMSLIMGASFIRSGTSDLILAGGSESMSGSGFALSGQARWGYKYLSENQEAVIDLLHRDGLSDPMSGESMGVQAEWMAQEHKVNRLDLDKVAANSHARAHSATSRGRFQTEITPIRTKKGLLEHDEGIRPDTTVEALGLLKPIFQKDGVLTAGNSSQISDGAAAILLASEEVVKEYQFQPIAQILGYTWTAGSWERYLEAPVEAARQALSLVGLGVEEIDLFENNEAFSLSTLLFTRELGIDAEKLNVNGGALALGHPIGCSGARIIVTLTHELRARGQSLGLATLCHGTGGGTAIIIESL